MRVLIIERNLIWSARLANSVRALGFEAEVVDKLAESFAADVAILNLAEPDPDAVIRLHEAGVKVIAHAGHKEKERLEIGRVAGCDLVVTNSELTYNLAALLSRL